MFLRATTRKKDGKEHRYFSVVEDRRVSGRTGAATAGAVFGGDQRLAGARVAALDRGVGRGNPSRTNAGAISRGSLRRGSRGRVDRAPEAGAIAARAAAAMGCMLACLKAVAAARAR